MFFRCPGKGIVVYYLFIHVLFWAGTNINIDNLDMLTFINVACYTAYYKIVEMLMIKKHLTLKRSGFL